MKFKTPEVLQATQHSFCPGCGHGIATRLVAEAVEELGISEDLIHVSDVACGSLNWYTLGYDAIMAAHGRPVVVAAGAKRARKNKVVMAYLGDGAAYSIGLAETMHCAMRDENITVIVINNGVYGMTGGQMAPTTLEGQKTSTSVYGRDVKKSGDVFDVKKVMGGLDISYLARGSVDSPGNIIKAGKYIKKALEKQMNNEGFSLIEIMSTCPTNWGISPVDSMKRLKEESLKKFELGEFIDRKAGN